MVLSDKYYFQSNFFLFLVWFLKTSFNNFLISQIKWKNFSQQKKKNFIINNLCVGLAWYPGDLFQTHTQDLN